MNTNAIIEDSYHDEYLNKKFCEIMYEKMKKLVNDRGLSITVPNETDCFVASPEELASFKAEVERMSEIVNRELEEESVKHKIRMIIAEKRRQRS